MQRTKQFAFRVSIEERRAIAKLATALQRSQSDAVRFVVVTAIRELEQVEENQGDAGELQRGSPS